MKKERNALGLTQNDVAQVLDLSRPTIIKIEKGERALTPAEDAKWKAYVDFFTNTSQNKCHIEILHGKSQRITQSSNTNTPFTDQMSFRFVNMIPSKPCKKSTTKPPHKPPLYSPQSPALLLLNPQLIAPAAIGSTSIPFVRHPFLGFLQTRSLT